MNREDFKNKCHAFWGKFTAHLHIVTDQSAPRGHRTSAAIKFVALLSLLLGMSYVVATLFFHSMLVALWRLAPIFTSVVVGIGGSILLARYPKDGHFHPFKISCLLWVLFMTLLTCTLWVTNHDSRVIDAEIVSYMNVQPLSDLPETDDKRILTRDTALRYAKDVSDGNTAVGHVHLCQEHTATGGTKLYWQAPLVYDKPDTLPRVLLWPTVMLRSTQRVVRLDAETSLRVADEKSGASAFAWFGNESWITGALFKLRHPFSVAAEAVNQRQQDGTWLVVIPYTSYTPTRTGTMIPVLAGVMAVGPYGSFNNYSPEEAATLFAGATLFPPELAEHYAKAYSTFYNGFLNGAVYEKNLREISEDDIDASTNSAATTSAVAPVKPGTIAPPAAAPAHNSLPNTAAQIEESEPGVNRLPYIQEIKGMGLQQVVPLEPRGAQAYKLVDILFFDCITGKVRSCQLPDGAELTGPRTAMHNLTAGDTDAHWMRFKGVEPRYVHKKGKGTFWLVTVIDKTTPSKAFEMLILSDARTTEAHRFHNVEELHKFLGEDTTGK